MGTFLIPVFSLAISALGGVAQYMQQSAQAQAQADYQQKMAESYAEANARNAQEAIKEQVEQSAAERIQQMQEQDSADTELQRAQVDMLKAKGTALASAGSGNYNLDAIISDYERGFGQNADVIRQQLDMYGVGHDVNIRAAKDRAAGRISSQQKYIAAPVSQPSIFGAALSIAGNTFGTYNQITDFGKNPLFARNKTTP